MPSEPHSQSRASVMSDTMSRSLSPDARDAFSRDADGRAASRRASASCVSRSGKGRGAAGNAEAFFPGPELSRMSRRSCVFVTYKRRKVVSRESSSFASPGPPLRASPLACVVRSKRRRSLGTRVASVHPRRSLLHRVLGLLGELWVEVVEFPVRLRRALSGFPLFHLRNRCCALFAGRRERRLLRVLRGFLRGHRGGVSVEGSKKKSLRVSATRSIDARAEDEKKNIRPSREERRIRGSVVGLDRPGPTGWTRGRVARVADGVRRSVVENRCDACARVKKRESETSKRVPHLSARAWGVSPSVLPLLPPCCFFRFFSLDCSRLRPRAMSSSYVWGKGLEGGATGIEPGRLARTRRAL